jgi:hypothetical protein
LQIGRTIIVTGLIGILVLALWIVVLYILQVTGKTKRAGTTDNLGSSDEKKTDTSEETTDHVMASASVPDASVRSRPKIPTSATKGEKRAVAIAVGMALISFGAYSWAVNRYITSLSVAQVNLAMPMIIQLDSFLTAGWIVGFFYFWSELEKALTGSKNARLALWSKDPTRQFDTAQRTILHQSMQRQEKELTPTFGLFAEIVLGAVMFIISAITAVFAVLVYALIFVQLSLEFMAGGVLVMIITWIALRYITQRLRELTDAAIAETTVRSLHSD